MSEHTCGLFGFGEGPDDECEPCIESTTRSLKRHDPHLLRSMAERWEESSPAIPLSDHLDIDASTLLLFIAQAMEDTQP